MMDRRDALKGLAAIAASAGLSVTPVTAQDAGRVTLVILKPGRHLSHEEIELLRQQWTRVCEDTALEGIRTAILDDTLDVEFVRA